MLHDQILKPGLNTSTITPTTGSIGVKIQTLNYTSQLQSQFKVTNITFNNATFAPQITNATDYYAFGAPMPGRQFSSLSYRYGFNGQEKDNEIPVAGGDLDFGARIYDSRLGRWMSIDPLTDEFPNWSPYNFALCNPIKFYDIGGLGPGDGVVRIFITSIKIKNKDGVIQTVYVAKRYYQNITVNQANNFKAKAQTPNGWYMVSKEEYEIQNGQKKSNGSYTQKPNINSFTSQTYGADDYEKIDENIFTLRSRNLLPLNGNNVYAHEIKNLSGTLLFDDISKTTVVPYTCTVIAVDKVGAERILGTVGIEQGTRSRLSYSLTKGEYIRFQYSSKTEGTATQISIQVSPPALSTNRAPDTINDYGTETPTQEDKQAIENLSNDK